MPGLLQQKLLKPEQLAEMIGLTPETLAQWRCEGRGPVFIKVSERRVLYAESAVEIWLQSRQKGGPGDAKSNRSSKKGRVLVLPVHGGRSAILRNHRFGGHRTK